MAEDPLEGGSAPPATPDVDEEFKFLLCGNCGQEAEHPKLLPCLHNVCMPCLQETKPVSCCPVCQAPHSQGDGASLKDNLLFANLRTKLGVYQKIKSGQDLVCDSCKREGAYWCPECQEFMCTSCFESHQRYLKRENHEARALADIKAESGSDFLTQFKNVTVMFCPNTEHKTERVSIYCKACERSLCCTCAVLDSQHNGQHCFIREEIQRQQQELLNLSTELTEKKASCDQSCSDLREQVKNIMQVKNQTKERIQEKVEEMVRLVREKGEQFLAMVQERHQHQDRDLEEKLHNMELMVQRMESGKQLVKNMNLYASDQEVIDMYPIIRGSLEELKRSQPPEMETRIQVGNFEEVESQLQAFYERVMQDTEAAPVAIQIVSNQRFAGKRPVKRKNAQGENTFQAPQKMIKIDPCNGEWRQSSGQVDLEQPGTSSTECLEGNGGNVWNGEDTVLIPDQQSPISVGSSNTDTPNGLNDCTEGESGDDDERAGSNLQEDINSESSQDNVWRTIFCPPKQLFSGEGALVFFDLKVLPGRILHLVAVTDEAVFSVMIQPLLSSPREDVEGGLCEIGLEAFLRYLLSLHQPIMVGYDLWSMDLPILVNYLAAIKQEEIFKAAVFGFLDALPLIKEKIPNLSSYSLKRLDDMYFWGQLDDKQVIDCAKTVKDLCTILDVSPGLSRRPLITYSSLQCYDSLQPLLMRRLLSRSTVQTLASHGICLTVLLSVYRKDPARGLRRFTQYLNTRHIRDGTTVQQLGKTRPYFEALPSASQASAFFPTKPGTCLCH